MTVYMVANMNFFVAYRRVCNKMGTRLMPAQQIQGEPVNKAKLTLHCVPQSNVSSEVRIVGVQDFKQSLYQTAARDCVALPSK